MSLFDHASKTNTLFSFGKNVGSAFNWIYGGFMLLGFPSLSALFASKSAFFSDPFLIWLAAMLGFFVAVWTIVGIKNYRRKSSSKKIGIVDTGFEISIREIRQGANCLIEPSNFRNVDPPQFFQFQEKGEAIFLCRVDFVQPLKTTIISVIPNGCDQPDVAPMFPYVDDDGFANSIVLKLGKLDLKNGRYVVNFVNPRAKLF